MSHQGGPAAIFSIAKHMSGDVLLIAYSVTRDHVHTAGLGSCLRQLHADDSGCTQERHHEPALLGGAPRMDAAVPGRLVLYSMAEMSTSLIMEMSSRFARRRLSLSVLRFRRPRFCLRRGSSSAAAWTPPSGCGPSWRRRRPGRCWTPRRRTRTRRRRMPAASAADCRHDANSLCCQFIPRCRQPCLVSRGHSGFDSMYVGSDLGGKAHF